VPASPSREQIRAARAPGWAIWLLYLLGFCSVAALIAIAFQQGRMRAKVDWQQAVEGRQQLEQAHAGAQKEIERLKAALEFEQARANRELQINKQALDEISVTLLTTSREIADLKEDLRFYESIIRTEGQGKGVQVRALRVSGTDQPDKFRYTLIVVNGTYGKKKTRAAARIELHGVYQGGDEVIAVKDDQGSEKLPLHFKYFQRLDGAFTLPWHFQPRRLHVSINMHNKKTAIFEKWYDWPLLVAGQEQKHGQNTDPEASGVEHD
jgi:hypothetical protein